LILELTPSGQHPNAVWEQFEYGDGAGVGGVTDINVIWFNAISINNTTAKITIIVLAIYI
jgi:hypothetical protein